MKRKKLEVDLFGRRDVLRLGGAAAAGLSLPGCDLLTLPQVRLDQVIEPVTPNELFYIQSAFGTPDVDPQTHRLSILDRGVEIGSLDRDFVLSLPERSLEHTLQCIGSNPRFLFISNAVWGGLPFTEVLDAAGVQIPSSERLRIEGADDYRTAIPATDLHGSSADTGTDLPLWLVWVMNGEALPLAHGAPFRFLTPGRYGTKNPKWPTAVDFIDEEFLGTWESRGWSDAATYRVNSLILSPPTGLVVNDESVRILGSAFCGPWAIEDVEVSADGGDTWEPAAVDYTRGDVWAESPVDYEPGAQVWTLWHFDFVPPEAGNYRFIVRVQAANGTETVLDQAGSDRLGGWDAGMEIVVEVR
jgi:DMSO/TMAO reductase YedYZ molybdopterin-dependent catalytic subunit